MIKLHQPVEPVESVEPVEPVGWVQFGWPVKNLSVLIYPKLLEKKNHVITYTYSPI